MYVEKFNRSVPSSQLGTLTPTVSLEGLADLLEALSIELGEARGLIPLWGNELKRELNERLRQ